MAGRQAGIQPASQAAGQPARQPVSQPGCQPTRQAASQLVSRRVAGEMRGGCEIQRVTIPRFIPTTGADALSTLYACMRDPRSNFPSRPNSSNLLEGAFSRQNRKFSECRFAKAQCASGDSQALCVKSAQGSSPTLPNSNNLPGLRRTTPGPLSHDLPGANVRACTCESDFAQGYEPTTLALDRPRSELTHPPADLPTHPHPS